MDNKTTTLITITIIAYILTHFLWGDIGFKYFMLIVSLFATILLLKENKIKIIYKIITTLLIGIYIYGLFNNNIARYVIWLILGLGISNDKVSRK